MTRPPAPRGFAATPFQGYAAGPAPVRDMTAAHVPLPFLSPRHSASTSRLRRTDERNTPSASRLVLLPRATYLEGPRGHFDVAVFPPIHTLARPGLPGQHGLGVQLRPGRPPGL